MTKKDPTPDNSVPMDEVKKQADKLGCYMQLFIAYNPETEVLMVASNAPDAETQIEAALLLALASSETADKLRELAGLGSKDAAASDDGDTTQTIN
jgi:hypothetical protein